jgi:hypothetical protein
MRRAGRAGCRTDPVSGGDTMTCTPTAVDENAAAAASSSLGFVLRDDRQRT